MKEKSISIKKITELITVLENARRIHRSCNYIGRFEEMSYFTNNIETYLDGIVGIVETEIKEILLTEFLNGNILIKQSNKNYPSDKFYDVQKSVVSPSNLKYIPKLDEL